MKGIERLECAGLSLHRSFRSEGEGRAQRKVTLDGLHATNQLRSSRRELD